MIYTIENDKLIVGVKDLGSELTSVKSKATAKEYLWQGSEKYWLGQSPILFPIVGRLIDDEYTFENKKYSLPQHGFARRMTWKMSNAKADEISFVLTETEETLKVYPFRFEVKVTFSLEGNCLKVSHDVLNTNGKTMYFSIGAHPAFNCEIGDRLVFSQKETLETAKIDLVRSLRMPESIPVLNEETDIVITEHIFDGDALVFKGAKSEYITLENDRDDYKVKFYLGNSPYLGIWSKPGAPYVCIEPWCGVNDSYEKKNDFSEKEGIISLEAGESFNYTWRAEFTAE